MATIRARVRRRQKQHISMRNMRSQRENTRERFAGQVYAANFINSFNNKIRCAFMRLNHEQRFDEFSRIGKDRESRGLDPMTGKPA